MVISEKGGFRKAAIYSHRCIHSCITKLAHSISYAIGRKRRTIIPKNKIEYHYWLWNKTFGGVVTIPKCQLILFTRFSVINCNCIGMAFLLWCHIAQNESIDKQCNRIIRFTQHSNRNVSNQFLILNLQLVKKKSINNRLRWYSSISKCILIYKMNWAVLFFANKMRISFGVTSLLKRKQIDSIDCKDYNFHCLQINHTDWLVM